MKRYVMLVMTLGLVLGLGHDLFAQGEGGLSLGTFESQLTSGEDSSGYVQFTVTANAWNNSDYGQQFNVPVRGLDSNGNTVISVTISGRLGARESGTLQGQGSMPLRAYDSIASWAQ